MTRQFTKKDEERLQEFLRPSRGEAPAMCWRQVVRRMQEEKPYIVGNDPGDENPEKEELISCA